MKFAFINSTRSWGGVKTWTVDYATELLARGHEVRVYARQPEFIDKLNRAGVRAKAAPFGFDFSPVSIGRFLSAFLRHRPDVVICNVGKDMNTAGLAARLLSIPVIQRVGMPRDMQPNPKLNFLLRTIRPWMLCPSQSVADGIFAHLPFVPASRVKVIRNAKRPRPDIRPVGPGPLRLISTSQVNRDKGHRFVLDALETLPAGAFQYHVVGTGKELENLQRRHKGLEERGDLVWHGFSDDVAGHLAGADVFLLPSRSEGMPNALLEAMAAGLIPVSRDIGGVREIWPQALDEFLMPNEAGADEFRAALDSLSRMEPARLDALKRISLEACRSTFSLTDRIDDFEAWVRGTILADRTA